MHTCCAIILAFLQVINVGFLNEDVEERMETYCNSFDVLVLEDGGFEWVLDLVEDVIRASK